MNDYLFSVPASYELGALSLVLAIFGCLVSGGAIWYYKKRREQVKLEVGQRQVIRFHAKINLGIMVAYLIYVLSRLIHLNFLSYRVIGSALLFAVLINVIIASAKVIRYKSVPKTAVVADSDSTYSKYLPKKKKK